MGIHLKPPLPWPVVHPTPSTTPTSGPHIIRDEARQPLAEFVAGKPGDRNQGADHGFVQTSYPMSVQSQTHDFIAYTERPVTGNPNDTWDALTGNQTGRVDIAAYMDWLCEHGYFERGSAQCASGGAP